MTKLLSRIISGILMTVLMISPMVPGLTASAAYEESQSKASAGYTYPAYISGYEDGTFRPEGTTTRAEAAQMIYPLWRDQDVLRSTEVLFKSYSDVPEGAWYFVAVGTLGGWRVINGYEDGTFRPETPITRAELVTAAVKLTGIDISEAAECSFTDVSTTHLDYGYIAAAVNAGIINGYADGSFRPEKSVTRAEAVTIINRALGRDGISEGNAFSDVPQSHWAYEAITAAATEYSADESDDADEPGEVKVTNSIFNLELIYNEANYEYDFVDGEVLVKLNDSFTAKRLEALLDASYATTVFGLAITQVQDMDSKLVPGVLLLTLAEGGRQSVLDAIAALKDNPEVYFAQPNYLKSNPSGETKSVFDQASASYAQSYYASDFVPGEVVIIFANHAIEMHGEALLDPEYVSEFLGLNIVAVDGYIDVQSTFNWVKMNLEEDSRQSTLNAVAVLIFHPGVCSAYVKGPAGGA